MFGLLRRWTRRPEPERVATPMGEMTRHGAEWEGRAPGPSGSDLTFRADDVSGAPDPAFLQRLPSLLADLTRYETLARQGVDRINDAYLLEAVSGEAGDPGFTLWFGYDEPAWGETVWVFLEGDEVVGWGAMD